jgi:predicted nucleic acid-binding protein
MIVVDASVWVSLFVANDSHHSASRSWLAGAVKARELIVAPISLLAEVSGAIARRTGQPELGRKAVEHMMHLPALRLVAVDNRLGRLAASTAADCQLRGADALYVAVAQRLNSPLITWDKEQLTRAAALVVTYTPDHALSDSIA